MTDTPAQDAPKKPRKLKLLIVLVLTLLVLGGTGAGAFYWFKVRASAPQAAAAPESESGMLPLDPFVVNLADTDAPRFLRVTLRLIVSSEKDAKRIEEDPVRLTKVRSAVLELLTTQQSSKLTTPEGKTELKKQIAERSSHVLESIEVRDVLFSEFVVQF